ncbi:MAG: intermembrane transport protein PqiB, partial [Pseudomonadales bacterium]
SVGDPILYRGFTVGHIQTYSYDTKAGQAKYDIFIESPYDSLVTSNSHFWNTGGISVKSSAQGFSVDVGTLETLISGGIAFDVPEDLPLGEAVTKPRQFTLYKNRQDVTDKREYQAFEYVVRVDESVRGLYKGAPVQYRGIRVGSVSSPYINFTQAKSLKVDEMDLVSKIAVVIRIEPERLLGVSTAEEVEAFNQEFKQSIKHGLTASIETANLISGSLMVNLDFNGEPLAQLDNFGPYTVIPSTVEGFNKLTDSLANILETMEQLPLQELVVSLNSTLQSADAALRGADQTLQSLRTSANQVSKLLKSDETAKLTANVNASLREMRKVLKGLQPESSAYREVQATLYKMQKTLDELQPTLKKIGNNPSAIIFSTPRDRDLEPKKK